MGEEQARCHLSWTMSWGPKKLKEAPADGGRRWLQRCWKGATIFVDYYEVLPQFVNAKLVQMKLR